VSIDVSMSEIHGNDISAGILPKALSNRRGQHAAQPVRFVAYVASETADFANRLPLGADVLDEGPEDDCDQRAGEQKASQRELQPSSRG
jgi:hypothetical protein